VDSVDFTGHPEEARLLINDWAHDNCGISNLFPPGTIDVLTFMVLVNTMKLSASWADQFDPDFTYSDKFTRLGGSTINVDYMCGESNKSFFSGTGFQALELPFEEKNISMVLILPAPGNFNQFETELSPVAIDTIIANMQVNWVRMDIPKFIIWSEYSLIGTMKDMGLTLPFSPGADFSGIDGVDDGTPWVNALVHKSEIWVDEYGVEASAATGMGLTIGESACFRANRPFIFLISDMETGAILFMGRVVYPFHFGGSRQY
jgi:serpin B